MFYIELMNCSNKKIESAASNHTVDGSEIPFPTTVWMYKTLQMMGLITNLN